MTRNVRVDENCDFQQIALPLDLTIGEHVLIRKHLEADSESGAWHELYLIVTPNGFLVEQHSGSIRGYNRLKETWFRCTLPEAKRKYSQILNRKLHQKRRSSGKYTVANDENHGQQQLFN